MNLRRRYNNPPIVEAVCELHFKPGLDWDATMSGKVHAELGEAYPGKPRERRHLSVKGDGVQVIAKVQLVTKSEKRMVGIGPNVLSVHMQRPYQAPQHPGASGWDEFRSRIGEALDAYWQVAQPEGVRRIGIRYINKIELPREEAQVVEYLRLPEVLGLPSQMIYTLSRIEYAYPDDVKLVLSQGKVEEGVMLDLDVIWESNEALTRMNTFSRIDDLRKREREAFEAVITDKARELFNADG